MMKQWHVVAYDVADARRLRRVHRCVSRQALAVQRSVFLFHGTRGALRRLLAELATLIDAERDDVRAYPSAHPGRMWMSSGIESVEDGDSTTEEPTLLAANDESGEWATALRKLWRSLGGRE